MKCKLILKTNDHHYKPLSHAFGTLLNDTDFHLLIAALRCLFECQIHKYLFLWNTSRRMLREVNPRPLLIEHVVRIIAKHIAEQFFGVNGRMKRFAVRRVRSAVPTVILRSIASVVELRTSVTV